jgi:hypothetical protein
MKLMRRLRRGVEQEFGAATHLDTQPEGIDDFLDRAVFVLFDDGVRVGELLFRLNEMTRLSPCYNAFVGAAKTPNVLRDEGLVKALAPHVPKDTADAPIALPLSVPLMHAFGVDASARYAQPMPIALSRIAEQRRPILHLVDSDLTRVAIGSLAQDLGLSNGEGMFRLEPTVVARRARNHELRAAAMERMLNDLDVKVDQIDLDVLRGSDWRAEMRRALIALSLYSEIPLDAEPVAAGVKLMARVSNRDEIRSELRRLRRSRA